MKPFLLGLYMLTQEKVKNLFRYDEEVGHLFWINSKIKPRNGCIAGSIDNKRGYRRVGINGVMYKEHRLIWLYVYGSFPEEDIDHINGVRDDNRLSNLRSVAHAVNMQNQRTINSLGKTGIGMNKSGRYSAVVTLNYKKIYLGVYDTAEQAHDAYLKAKRDHHEGCTI